MHWLPTSRDSDEDTWISVSDMMAGLMMIFLFIAIIYIQNIGQYFDAVSSVRQEICNDLSEEFAPERAEWNMTICENGLLIRFENDSNFETNSAILSDEFKGVLSSFIPRLLDVVWKYRNLISELRIEGHTDSAVRPGDTKLSGYIYNTWLSQARSRNVLDFALHLPEVFSRENYLDWSFTNMTAHGMSSSELLYEGDLESMERSRRVEFRLKTRAEDKLMNLVAEIQRNGS